ncbi:MAG: NRDE family protein [Planctomycetota bacterium]
MCLLILLLGIDPEFPIVVAGNRDERRDRPSGPPGLFVGESRRMLSPRDRVAGGTWLGVSERGFFAGLTNLVERSVPDGASSRGLLPHRALDQSSIQAAGDRVEELVGREPFGGFQLLLADGARAELLSNGRDGLERKSFGPGAVVITNEHRVDALKLPDLDAAAAPGLPLEERLERLRQILLDTGERSGHRVLKKGGDYGTVSSSLIAVPKSPQDLVWQFAAGEPDTTPFRNYGNLGRRLIEG